MVAIGDEVEMFRHNFFTVSCVTQEKIRKYPRVLSNKRDIRQSMFGDLCVTTLDDAQMQIINDLPLFLYTPCH